MEAAAPPLNIRVIGVDDVDVKCGRINSLPLPLSVSTSSRPPSLLQLDFASGALSTQLTYGQPLSGPCRTPPPESSMPDSIFVESPAAVNRLFGSLRQSLAVLATHDQCRGASSSSRGSPDVESMASQHSPSARRSVGGCSSVNSISSHASSRSKRAAPFEFIRTPASSNPNSAPSSAVIRSARIRSRNGDFDDDDNGSDYSSSDTYVDSDGSPDPSEPAAAISDANSPGSAKNDAAAVIRAQANALGEILDSPKPAIIPRRTSSRMSRHSSGSGSAVEEKPRRPRSNRGQTQCCSVS